MKLLTPELLILAQMCTKSFVGWGFAPDPTGGAYSAPPDPLGALRGPTSRGKGGVGRGKEGWGGERKGWEGREGRGQAPRILGLEPPLLMLVIIYNCQLLQQLYSQKN